MWQDRASAISRKEGPLQRAPEDGEALRAPKPWGLVARAVGLGRAAEARLPCVLSGGSRQARRQELLRTVGALSVFVLDLLAERPAAPRRNGRRRGPELACPPARLAGCMPALEHQTADGEERDGDRQRRHDIVGQTAEHAKDTMDELRCEPARIEQVSGKRAVRQRSRGDHRRAGGGGGQNKPFRPGSQQNETSLRSWVVRTSTGLQPPTRPQARVPGRGPSSEAVRRSWDGSAGSLPARTWAGATDRERTARSPAPRLNASGLEAVVCRVRHFHCGRYRDV